MPRWLEPVHAFIKSRWFFPTVFLACLAPAVVLAVDFCRAVYWGQPEALGANPAESLIHRTGEDALAILLITLSVTPLRRLTGWNKIQRVRRLLGVWSFFYALAHMSMYLVFDQNCTSWSACEFHAIWVDVLKRKFIFAGMLAFVILLALAVTSTNGMIRRLGRAWLPLHRLVYVGAVAAIIHFIWGQKADISEPLRWAVWLAVLLGLRVYYTLRKRRLRLTH